MAIKEILQCEPLTVADIRVSQQGRLLKVVDPLCISKSGFTSKEVSQDLGSVWFLFLVLGAVKNLNSLLGPGCFDISG